jgi:hypothetical protein
MTALTTLPGQRAGERLTAFAVRLTEGVRPDTTALFVAALVLHNQPVWDTVAKVLRDEQSRPPTAEERKLLRVVSALAAAARALDVALLPADAATGGAA